MVWISLAAALVGIGWAFAWLVVRAYQARLITEGQQKLLKMDRAQKKAEMSAERLNQLCEYHGVLALHPSHLEAYVNSQGYQLIPTDKWMHLINVWMNVDHDDIDIEQLLRDLGFLHGGTD